MNRRNEESLRREARAACLRRGHHMTPFSTNETEEEGRFRRHSKCRRCGMGVQILTHPAPNEIDIGGEAVALNCPGQKF